MEFRKLPSLLAAVAICVVILQAGLSANPLGIPDAEYNALVALYNSTDGANWNNNSNWLTANPEWYGVTVENGHVTALFLSHNNLSGPLPAELGSLTGLRSLYLNGNNLTGAIPPELGGLSSIDWLDLGGNQLTGSIPSSITALTSLHWADLGYNMLTASDPAVVSFLSTRDCCNWQSTQTVPPTGVSAWLGDDGTAQLYWTPIAFTWPGGYYEVGYSYTPGGPYTFDPANRTEDKWDDNLRVYGLDPGRPVYFVVRTVTPAHEWNASTLVSANSEEIEAQVLPTTGKYLPDGTIAWSDEVVITAVFPDCCYVESLDRSWGIRCEAPEGGYPDPGTKVRAVGVMTTNDDGERVFEVYDGYETGFGTVAPLCMPNRMLGGADWRYDPGTGAGQRGATGGAGLNNIGLLVRTTGACSYVDEHTFIIDDGSGVSVTCITPPTILVSPAWRYVAVTGASSISRDGEVYSRLIRVTQVEPLASEPPEGVTGRWEMTNTSGELAGVFGMLLVQQGSTVTGSVRGIELVGGQMDGGVFTASFSPEEGMTILSSMTLDGDTLTGTWTAEGGAWSLPVVFHRVSPDPTSPYANRPKVLSASCNGWSISVAWDRPINGWDFDMRNQYGERIEWHTDHNNIYDPDTHTYQIPFYTTAPLVPGETYTIYLDSGDSVDWHDPYGAPAWAWADDCYSFQYTHQQLPEPPAGIVGYHAPGMPAQWVTISAQWPSGCDSLKLYRSSDKAVWFDTGLTPTPRGNSGDFTFELWDSAYFRVTAMADGLESPPGPTVHARPFEVEQDGVVVDSPSDAATGVSQVPLIQWHPGWSQSAILNQYVIQVRQAATNALTWMVATAQSPPQTMLIYGQTNGLVTIQPADGPLAPGTQYWLHVMAQDDENWVFAAGDSHFTTGSGGGGSGNLTGAWEMTNTSGPIAGCYGVLLVQIGNEVYGSMRGWTLENGQMNGNEFTCSFTVEDGPVVMSQLTLEGDTLTGTWSIDGGSEVFPITLHRVSLLPASPYQGRPQVVSATCDGTAVHVTWDRPVNGWDYDIRRSDGTSVVGQWDNTELTYDPDTYTFHIPIHTWTRFIAGEHYTVYLESGDEVDWHDPYGAPAWDSVADCYSFDYLAETGAQLHTIRFDATGSGGQIGQMEIEQYGSEVGYLGFYAVPLSFASVGSSTIIPENVIPGSTFTTTGWSLDGEYTAEVSVASVSDAVNTPAGVFVGCLRMVEHITYADINRYIQSGGFAITDRIRWFAPGVGPVAYEATYAQAGGSTFTSSGVLQSYAIVGNPDPQSWWPLTPGSTWVFDESGYVTVWTVTQ